MRFAGISGCLSAAVLALGVGGAPVVQADALGDSLEQAHIRKATFAAPAWEAIPTPTAAVCTGTC